MLPVQVPTWPASKHFCLAFLLRCCGAQNVLSYVVCFSCSIPQFLPVLLAEGYLWCISFPLSTGGLIRVHICMSAWYPVFRGSTVFWHLFCRSVCQEGMWCVHYSYDANAQAPSPASHFCVHQCMAFQLNSVVWGDRNMTLFSLLKSVVGWLCGRMTFQGGNPWFVNKNALSRLGHSLVLNSLWSLGLEQNECKRVEKIIP